MHKTNPFIRFKRTKKKNGEWLLDWVMGSTADCDE